MLKASYRFFDNEIDPDAMLQSHVEATGRRITTVPLVLAVNDTTELDSTHHPATMDLGRLSSANQQGLLAHTTLAITPERVLWVLSPSKCGGEIPKELETCHS